VVEMLIMMEQGKWFKFTYLPLLKLVLNDFF
jgi:hypothetical protein